MAASMIKDKLSGRKSPDVSCEELAEKYKLRVTAGPYYDQDSHKPVYVNTNQSCFIENEFVRAQIKVRIRNYHGLPKGSEPMSPYFNDPMHVKDQYSVAFSFVPKQDLPSRDTVWGNDFDHPVRDRLPPGFNTAFKIVKEFIDPGLTCDAYADKPWLYGPSLSCWFAFVVGDKIGEGEDVPALDEKDVMKDGADGSGDEVRQRLGIPDTADKRRKFFLDAKHREDFTFEKGRCYQGDFFNPYLDFGNLALKLPGFSIGVVKYIDNKSHVLRYVFKNRETGDLYFNINFTLLFGDQLNDAVANENEPQEEAGAVAVNGNDNETKRTETAEQDEEAQPTSRAQSVPRAQAAETSKAEAQDQRPKSTPDGPPGSPLGPSKPPGYEYPEEDQPKPDSRPDDNKTVSKTEVSEITEMLRGTATNDKTNLKSSVLGS